MIYYVEIDKIFWNMELPLCKNLKRKEFECLFRFLIFREQDLGQKGIQYWDYNVRPCLKKGKEPKNRQ
jgi:predicted secreted protein